MIGDRELGGRAAVPRARSRSRWTLSAQEQLTGFVLISPWLLGFVAFVLGPVLASLYFSLTSWNMVARAEFVGLRNYATAFTADELFWPSLGRTALYSLLNVPLSLVASLAIALLLNRGLRGSSTYRTLAFLPSLTPVVAAAVIWQWVLAPDLGMLNQLLASLGIAGPRWLGDPAWAMPSLIMINLWLSVGGSAMIVFLAGLQGVPRELYEAASIDGARAWAKFRHVTVPQLSPVIFFNLVMGIIHSFKSFDLAFVTTQGGPSRATWFLALHIYDQAFKSFNAGYASALSWILFVVVISILVLQWRLSSRWIYAASEQ